MTTTKNGITKGPGAKKKKGLGKGSKGILIRSRSFVNVPTCRKIPTKQKQKYPIYSKNVEFPWYTWMLRIQYSLCLVFAATKGR